MIGKRAANSQKKTASKTANDGIRKTERKPAATDAGGAVTANDEEGEPTENAGILKPLHEQFAQNVAQVAEIRRQ